MNSRSAMKKSLLILAMSLVLAGCAGDRHAKLDANEVAVSETFAWPLGWQDPRPDTKECSPDAFLSGIEQGDTEGVRALCTEKGFRDVKHLGFERIKDITQGPWWEDDDGGSARFNFITPPMGGTVLCVIQMRMVGDEWKVDAITDTSRQKSE